MNSLVIEEFVKKNIANFRLNGPGWVDLIEKMLFEFCIAGWDLHKAVGGKEKFGGLRCYNYLEAGDADLEKKIKKIIDKYSAIAAKTCEQCGGTAQKRVRKNDQWESTLCKQCYLKSESQTAGNPREQARSTEFSECKICGHFAVSDDRCHFCRNTPYSSDSSIFRPADYYENEEDYIKECQIEAFLDEEDQIELSRKTKSFRRSDAHEVIFTIEDLERYIENRREE